jgi:hypothetical protein
MSSSTFVNVYIMNDLGYTIGQCWLNHTTSGTNWTEAWNAQNIPQGGSTLSLGWTLEIVSSTNDYFTVLWTDQNNNVWCTPMLFKAECSTSGGTIEVQLQGNGTKVEILQSSSTNGSASFSEYILAAQPSEQARAAAAPIRGTASRIAGRPQTPA